MQTTDRLIYRWLKLARQMKQRGIATPAFFERVQLPNCG